MASPDQARDKELSETFDSNGNKNPSGVTPSQQQQDPSRGSRDRREDDDNPDQGVHDAIADLHRREDELNKREQDLSQREAKLKCRREDLTKREEEAAAAERRLKKAENTGPADLLAAHQENEKLKNELARLNNTLKQERASAKTLQAEIEQLKRDAGQQPQQQGTTALSISAVGRKPLRLPQKLTPPTLTPKQSRPARDTPTGFTPALTDKMNVGRKSLAALRERRPPQTAVV